MADVKRSTTADEVALLLHQVSLPAARRDYELRSSSPAPRAPPRAATSSSQLVSRAFQNARAMSFNATTHSKDVPFVSHSERVYFSGPLSSQGMAHHLATAATAMGVRANATGGGDDEARVVEGDSDAGLNVIIRPSASGDHACEQGRISADGRDRSVRAINAGPVVVVGDVASGREARIARTGEAPRRARSGDLRAPKSTASSNIKNRPRSSELARELMRTPSSTWGREEAHMRSGVAMGARDVTRSRDGIGARDVARAVPEEVPKVEEKKRGESRRRPTASIAWDSLNESQANSPQHELAAIPFQWEEAPGKPLAMRVREDSQLTTARLVSRGEAQPLSRAEEVADMRAQSHRFYSRAASQCELPARKSSFDSASAHLISEVVSSIDLVAPAAAKFLVESWVSPNVAPEAHVAVPFQWEEAPGVPLKLDGDEEEAYASTKLMAPLQLPPRLASPAPPAPSMSKEDMRGRLRTRSMSGPLAGYYPHASPARRRQLQHSPVPQRRSCSPSKRSISPSRIHAIAQHFSSHRKSDRSHSALTGGLEAELGDTTGNGGYGAGLGRSASGALMPEFGRSPRRYNLSPTRRSVSPSRRIQALAKQITCKIRPAVNKLPPNSMFAKSPQTDPWSPVNLPDELHLSGPSSNNSDMDASSQTPPSGVAFSKSLSRVSYESFEHSFVHRAATAATKTTAAPAAPVAVTTTTTSTTKDSPSRDEALLLLASPPPPSTTTTTDDSKTVRTSNANSNANSSPGSPYLGPSAAAGGGQGHNHRRGGSPLGAAEGTVKAMVKLCRSGSSALRKTKSSTTSGSMQPPPPSSSAQDLWAPTLASYFHCLEAATLISHPGSVGGVSVSRSPAALTSDPCCGADDSPPALPTRLPYTMPYASEQNLLWKDYCESPNSQLGSTSCLGHVKIAAPASLFLSRRESSHHHAHPNNNNNNNKRFPAATSETSSSWRVSSSSVTEEGYRSPAYAATLELLSPSAEVLGRKKAKRKSKSKSKRGGSAAAAAAAAAGAGGGRGIKLVVPSTRRRSQIMEVVCTSLRRALYKCARRCRRKACSPASLPSR